jgi:hypothetical protein
MSTSCPPPAPLLELRISFLLYKKGIVHKLCHFPGKVYENYPRIFIYTLHLQHFTMETKTLVIAAAVMIAATAAFALAPLLASSAIAAKGGVNPGGGTTETCVHNGNGRTSDGACSNPSGTTVTTTCTKVHGKFQCTTA